MFGGVAREESKKVVGPGCKGLVCLAKNFQQYLIEKFCSRAPSDGPGHVRGCVLGCL